MSNCQQESVVVRRREVGRVTGAGLLVLVVAAPLIYFTLVKAPAAAYSTLRSVEVPAAVRSREVEEGDPTHQLFQDALALRNRTLGLLRVQRSEASILYLHIYKSGGSTFCATARAAGQRVPADHGMVGNCNLMFNLNSLSPKEQLAKFKPYQVVANEYDGLPTLDAGLIPAHSVVYVTTLRNPFDRFLSHFRAAQVFSRRKEGVFENLDALVIPALGDDGGVIGGEGRCMYHDCSFRQFLAWLDQPEASRYPIDKGLTQWTKGDFIIRYFVGFDACKPGECDRTHLARAKARLDQLFTVIMFVEDYEVGWQTFSSYFGWPAASEEKGSKDGGAGSVRAGTHLGSSAHKEIGGDKRALAVLNTSVGQNDLEFYEFARNLAKARGFPAVGAQ